MPKIPTFGHLRELATNQRTEVLILYIHAVFGPDGVETFPAVPILTIARL
jgi:hypothetical protein